MIFRSALHDPRRFRSERSERSRVRAPRDARDVPELAGRLYVPKLYNLDADRGHVVGLLARAVEASGGRVIYNSFSEQRVAPIYIGAEDAAGRRYGMLSIRSRTTKRATRNRPVDEHRAQIRFGDPVRTRDECNVIARDVAGVDVTLVLAVDPEHEFIVGLDPLVYEDLPMGISVYYRDHDVASAADHGWAVWERPKKGRCSPQELGRSTDAGGLPPTSAARLREVRGEGQRPRTEPGPAGHARNVFRTRRMRPHDLEALFGVERPRDPRHHRVQLPSRRCCPGWRRGASSRGVLRNEIQRRLRDDPIDADGQPDFAVDLVDGRRSC